MIDDLSKTLRAVLTQPGLPAPLGAAQIVFDHPEESFQPQQTTVDLFLYDIREDLNLRSNEPLLERQDGLVITHRPPLRVACSYLVTAWPVGGAELPLQEHRLLSQVLQVLSRHATVPSKFLQGELKNQSPPLPMVTAVVDPQKNLSEFWAALGAKMRPSLTVTATIAIDLMPPEKAPIVTSDELVFGQRTPAPEREILPGSGEDMLMIGGVVSNDKGAPVPNASVTLVELGATTKTDSGGRYVLNRVKSGDFTLRVRAGGIQRDRKITVPAAQGGHYNVRLEK